MVSLNILVETLVVQSRTELVFYTSTLKSKKSWYIYIETW